MGRKKPHIHYIYKTTCNVTNRYYIGMHSTTNLEDGYLGSGKRLRYSIRKYGKENHTKEILEFLPTREDLVIRESEIVDNILLEDVLCMNLRLGGQGGFISEEQQKHRSICGNKKLNEKLKNDENFKNNFKKSVSEGLRKAYEKGVRLKKINENYSWVGKKHKPQTIEKFKQIREDLKSQSGNKNSQFGTCWITNGLENKKIIKGDVIPKGWFLGRKIK
jgi:hypothetical protein